MSLDRSPSPLRNGGFSSPGLTNDISHGKVRASTPGLGIHARHESRNTGLFGRWRRNLSITLPRWSHGGQEDRIAEKDRLERGRISGRDRSIWAGGWRDFPRRIGLLVSRRRKLFAMLLILVGLIWWWNVSLVFWYRRTPWLGGGSKFVLILGANQGGGVMEWKGAREWAIERDSVKNKKRYAAKWGYELDIVDMSTKKRYAHEWRESWEKVDVIRNAMKKYPEAEWFWWLDLNTFIMEPTYSLQSHIFSDLQHNSYRDINIYNPLQIQHPPNGTSSEAEDFENYLDAEALSLNGDGNPESINLIVPQDCGGFNLGSFFVRRSLWSDRMLDMWWDPVFYEQRHMQWEHKEQDALEYLYQSQPWIRSHVAFLPQRMINAFPNGACGDDRGIPADGCPNTLTSSLQSNNNNKKKPLEPDVGECGVQGIHYQQKERDFLVNMAGCEWGRDCWQEMYSFRQLSHRMNRSVWIQFKDWIWETWHWKEMRERKRVEVEKAEKQRREKVAKEQAEKVRVAQQEAQRQAEVEAQAQAEAEAEAEANARLTPEQQLRAEAHAEEVKRAQAQLDKESAAEREAQLEAQARLNAEKRAKVEAAA